MLEDGAFGWQMLLGAGGIAGVCAGLLGIGGAVVLVPALIYGLPCLGVDSPELPKIAMATSLGLIIPSTVASTQAHAARGTVDWSMWAIMAPALVAGSLVASLLVESVSISLLTLLFVGFCLMSARTLLSDKAPSVPTGVRPHLPLLLIKSGIVGVVSTLLGAGVGFFAVPTLSRFIAMTTAVGTASALALPMAVTGLAGYLYAQAPEGCAACTGYVHLPVVAAVGITSVLAVPLGTRLGAIAPVKLLRRMFAMLLVFGAFSLMQKKLPDIIAEAKATFALPAVDFRRGDEPAAIPAWLGRREPRAAFALAMRLGPRRGLLPLLHGRPALAATTGIIAPADRRTDGTDVARFEGLISALMPRIPSRKAVIPPAPAARVAKTQRLTAGRAARTPRSCSAERPPSTGSQQGCTPAPPAPAPARSSDIRRQPADLLHTLYGN